MRKPFRFSPRTSLYALDDDLDKLRAILPKDARVLCIYGGNSRVKSGVQSDLRMALEGLQYTEFVNVSSNPDAAELDRAAAVAKEFRATHIIAAGGGSVMDAGKLVSALALTEQDAWALVTRGPKGAPALPLVVVSTLAASGSETNAFATISNRATGQKLVYQNENVAPIAAFIVPKYSRSLPTAERANGVVDAFVHVLESYLTYDVGATLHEELAEGVLRTLLRVGPAYCESPDNLDAAAEVHLAAQVAQSGLLQQGVPEDWSTHFVAHELTALFGLAHARALAIALPLMLTLRRDRKAERLTRMARAVFGNAEPTPEAAIELVTAFFATLGVDCAPSAFALDEAKVTQLIDGLLRARRPRLGERLDIGLAELKQHLLKACATPDTPHDR